jgi:hypothetical protein
MGYHFCLNINVINILTILIIIILASIDHNYEINDNYISRICTGKAQYTKMLYIYINIINKFRRRLVLNEIVNTACFYILD